MTATNPAYESVDARRTILGIARGRFFFFLLILILVIGILGFWYWQSKSPADKATQALVKAYSKRRLIEPRLSGGFHAGEYDPNPNDLTNVDITKLNEAKEYIQNAVAYDAETRHAHARLFLASQESSKAMTALHPLRADQSASAEIHNDFGACLFEQGRIEEALDAFNRALEKSPAMIEGLFNRALCYQKLQLRDAAGDSLTRLKEVERDEGWKHEAQARLELVTQSLQPPVKSSEIIAAFGSAITNGDMDEARKIASQYPDKLREHGLEPLIKEYTQAVRSADSSRAARVMAELELIGNLLKERRGDKEIIGDNEMADFARFIRELPEEKRAANLDLIEQCSKEIDACYGGEYVKTLAGFERLEKEFARRGNTVFQVISAWMIAKIHYRFNRLKETVDTLEPTISILQQRGWVYQQARLIGLLGISYSRLGQDSRAITYCKQSLAACTKIGLLEAKGLQYVSLPYWHLGDFDTALKLLRDSTLLFIAKEQEPAELALNCLQAADIYRVRDRHDLSLLFASQALAFAEKSNEEPYASLDSSIMLWKPYAAQASSLMAIEQARLKQFDEANRNMEKAFQYLSQIDTDRARHYNKPLILTRAGEVAAHQGDISRALEYYSEAEPLVAGAQENKIPWIRVLRGRSDALISSGRFDEARPDLAKAINLIEEYRSKILSGEQRSYFLDIAHAVFDQAIALSMMAASGQVDGFNLSEQAHGRTLLEEVSNNKASNINSAAGLKSVDTDQRLSKEMCKPLELQEVKDALPMDLGVLQYAVTSQGTYLFLVTQSGLEVARSEATTEKLDSLVNVYLSELRRTYSSKDSAATEYLTETGRMLYRELISPIKARLGNITRLCIVPDKSLHFLPFASLVDEEGKYLIKTYELSYAPSSSVLVRCIKGQSGESIKRMEKIASIGNSSFDISEFPGLRDLPDAAKEAEDIAQLYGPGNGLPLTGAAATKARILEELKNCDVGHLALHCLVKDNSPWRAALVVAPASNAPRSTTQAGQSDSLLTLEEMHRVKFPHMRLAVLSACESGLGQYHRGEGIVSLVRPFIVSQVPTVVASLWPVDSLATRELMVEFHKERILLKGQPGQALRTAQLKLANSEYHQHPYYWASFIVIGSSN